MDDPVIARADGSVLYNFAAAIDDLDAAITHVVRGEDHLSNTPKQLLVLEAAREASLYEGSLAPELPVYAHLPLLYGRDGKKLSKRHGAASVQELRAAGYLPEAIRNYLALLGWGAGDDATVLSTAELIERFTLERVSRNPARFDEAKLSWLNGVYIRALPTSELSSRLEQFIVHDGITRAPISQQRPRLARATAISQEKIHTLSDFWPFAGFFFEERPLDPAARDRWLDGEGVGLLHEVRDELAAVARPEEPSEVKKALEAVVARARAKPRDVYQPLRVAISGTTVSPGIFESVALLGKDETLRRIDAVLADQGERQRGAGRAGETTSTPEA
jgi:glutamyl-tRNA synthetase